MTILLCFLLRTKHSLNNCSRLSKDPHTSMLCVKLTKTPGPFGPLSLTAAIFAMVLIAGWIIIYNHSAHTFEAILGVSNAYGGYWNNSTSHPNIATSYSAWMLVPCTQTLILNMPYSPFFISFVFLL